MSDRKGLSIAFLRIAELATASGLEKGAITRMYGAWRYKLITDDRWEFAVNGHKEAVVSPLLPNTNIEPFEAYVEYNGWPFATIGPYGGQMGAGELANEDTFIEALEKEIRHYGAEVEELV